MKKIFSLLYCLFFCTSIVQASGDGFFSVASEEALKECLTTKSACKLEENVAVTSINHIEGNVILDLNGHSIMADQTLSLKSGMMVIDHGGKLTLHDTKGTGKISTGPNGNVWASIQMAQNDNKEGTSELVVNSGTVEGYYYGIVGNGNIHNTKITINGGDINALNKDDSAGIYQPQKGEIEINGGTITGGTGIEIRSGSLNVNNGTIKGISPTFNRTANKNGTTTNGAGVAIAQHTTKNPITVNLKGGDYSGQYALYEWNPHNNSESDLRSVIITVTDGNFTSTIPDGYAVYSEDFKKFISGGKFNTEVTEYLKDGANITTTMKELNIPQNNHKIVYIILCSFVLGLGICYALYKKGIILNNLKLNH